VLGAWSQGMPCERTRIGHERWKKKNVPQIKPCQIENQLGFLRKSIFGPIQRHKRFEKQMKNTRCWRLPPFTQKHTHKCICTPKHTHTRAHINIHAPKPTHNLTRICKFSSKHLHSDRLSSIQHKGTCIRLVMMHTSQTWTNRPTQHKKLKLQLTSIVRDAAARDCTEAKGLSFLAACAAAGGCDGAPCVLSNGAMC